ncbi:DNA-binding transcriptional regulator, MarR family [Quadrisphaera granulorum]|uniref:DNA-binding MarR family transcriptional regulator n=1 Tax=Quadrisphaera granulorum TaxID=317664 RepID=A0A316A8Z3_9ACTN|nr:MarR family transcriptional regulator [Quadrisphaera granulorum]PWJ54161.1 DNA-binding MarR family transcriptional regulator [Quadrisphaera granulorum]SZE96300.1 DNA-binding transcriptional regulator, MarR family [Quadrisphaera granulorum]
MTQLPAPAPDATAVQRALQDLRIDMDTVTERVARSLGVNPRDLSVLDVLHAHGPATPTELADRTGITTTTLASTLQRLQRGGHVHRSSHPSDGRSSLITITSSTVQTLTDMYRPLNVRLAEVLDALDDEHRHVIHAFLRSVSTALTSSGVRSVDSTPDVVPPH